MRRLVIRPGAIGDCILSMPAISHLRADYTEIWLPAVVTPLFGGLADEVRPLASTGIEMAGVGDLAVAKSLVERLKSFDSVVSWYGTNRPEFREWMQKTGVPCEFHLALPPPDYQGHATDFFLEQVEAPPGGIPQLGVRGKQRRNSVVIHPFSGSKRKNWPLHCYQELGSRLPWEVEWSAGPEEELLEATRFDDLYALAEWMAGARLYIGNDSGITHVAAATGVPTLTLFGPTAPENWAARGQKVRVLRSDPLEQLTVETVLAAAMQHG